MKKVLSSIWNVAFAVAVAVALSFGAAEALTGPPQQAVQLAGICTYPDYCDDNDDCEYEICPPVYTTGWCVMSKNCCTCVD
jgi:hypothetical protein